MGILLSAKGNNITNWSAARDFAAHYRQTLLERAASNRSGNSEESFAAACAELEQKLQLHCDTLAELDKLIDAVGSAQSTAQLSSTSKSFYDSLYRHFSQFGSAVFFYQLSMSYLQQATNAIIRLAKASLGLFARHLPELAVVAIGPAGRGEYSPSCLLQFLIIHDRVPAANQQTIKLFCHTVHDFYVAAGLAVDETITPKASFWCASVEEWSERMMSGAASHDVDEIIDFCRFTDQFILVESGTMANDLHQLSTSQLRFSTTAQANLVQRMSSIPGGLGLMGRLKLEIFGSERGLFKLLDHGLLPFSAALSALSLIKGSTAQLSCDRIRDILQRREIDVNLAEKMLYAWHVLHDLRLWHEETNRLSGVIDHSICISPSSLSHEQSHQLKEALESVTLMQRTVENLFSIQAGAL